MEKVRRVVLALYLHKPVVVSPVGGSHALGAFVAQKIDVDAAAREELHIAVVIEHPGAVAVGLRGVGPTGKSREKELRIAVGERSGTGSDARHGSADMN